MLHALVAVVLATGPSDSSAPRAPVIEPASDQAPCQSAVFDMPIRLFDGATWSLTAHHTKQGMGTVPRFSVELPKQLTWRAARPTLTITNVSARTLEGPAGVEATQVLDVPAVVRVDASLKPVGLENGDDLRAATERLALRLTSRDALARMQGIMPHVLEYTALALVTPEVTHLSVAQGQSLAVGCPIIRRHHMPSPEGGPSVPATMRLTLEAYDAYAGNAIVTSQEEAEPGALREMLVRMARTVLPPSGTERAKAEAALKSVSGTLRQRCRHVVDLPTGLAVQADCVKEVILTISGETRRETDHWAITQVPPARQER